MGKILVVNYSQTGQLNEIIDQFLSPFDPESIERHQIEPAKPYVFPWTTEEFFDKMPECVQEEPIALKPIPFANDHYDLIVLDISIHPAQYAHSDHHRRAKYVAQFAGKRQKADCQCRR
jgi:hypothetical protein